MSTSCFFYNRKHYDPVILPPNSVGLLKSFIISPRNLVIDSTREALILYLSLYLKDWLTMETLMTDKDIKSIVKHVFSLFCCLKNQQYYSKNSNATISLNLSNDHILDKVIIIDILD